MALGSVSCLIVCPVDCHHALDHKYTGIYTLATGQATKTDDFSNKSQKGRVIFNPKFVLQILDLFIGLFFGRFLKQICNIIFRKWGGGSKAVWIFSKNSSVCVAWPIFYEWSEYLSNGPMGSPWRKYRPPSDTLTATLDSLGPLNMPLWPHWTLRKNL